MSDTYVKYQAVQGGPFTASQNLVDFRLPSSDIYDLHDSFVNLNCTLDVTEANDFGGNGVYNFRANWGAPTDYVGNDAPHVPNVAFVKNARMECASKGRIENLRRVDILRSNLDVYTKSEMENVDESYLDATPFYDPVNNQQYGPFTQLNKAGAVKSRYNELATPISIRLSDVFEFCRTREYDTTKAGETRIHFELNRSKLETVQVTTEADAVTPALVKQGIDTTGTASTRNNYITLGAAGSNVPLKFDSLQQSPYWVGQKLLITATHTDGGADDRADQPAVINEIIWDKDTGSIQLRFEQAWGAAMVAGKQYKDISIKFATATAVLSLDTAEIVLKRVDNPEGMDQISYNTYSTEQTNGNGLTSFQQLYTVEPEASNVVIAFPDGPTGLYSDNQNIDQWRLRLNNEDLTDRNVAKDTPLAYDRLAMTLNAMGTSLRSLNKTPGKVQLPGDWEQVFARGTRTTTLIANPLFQTAQQKLLQVNIESQATGVKSIVIYKQLPRVFEY